MIRFVETAESFSDIFEAKDAVLRFAESASKENRKSAHLILDPREYRLERPLVFDAQEAPSLKNIDLFMTCENGTATFTSNRILSRSKIEKEGDVYVYRFEKDENGEYPRFYDVYEDGYRMELCTSPHFTHAFAFSGENGRENDENLEGIYVPEEMAALVPDGDLFPLELMLYVEWEFFVLHVLSVDRSRKKIDENGNTHVLLKIVPEELYQYVMGMNMSLQPKDREIFFLNHPAFLKENTWCYDHTTGVLRFSPKFQLREKIHVPTMTQLLVFKGMDGVSLSGLTFTGITDKFLMDNGFHSHQAIVEKKLKEKVPDAAILTRDVRRFTVKHCEFRELGTNGILMLGRSVMVDIRDNYFHGISMSAVSVGDPVKARFAPQNCSFDVRIDHNVVSRVAYEFPAAPALQVFRVDGLSICHNTIEKCAYSGISAGWEWNPQPYALGEMVNIRDAEIAYNHITDHMQLLRDGGAIYVVGPNSIRSYARRFNSIHHNFTCNDRILKKVRGYYLDGSSSGWDVYQNVTSKMHYPIYIQYNVGDQFTWHNRIDDTYSTEPILPNNHHPERDTLVGATHIAPTLEALFEAFPEARAIMEESGAK